MAFSDPWTERDFHDCAASGTPFFVAADGAVIGGYVIAHYGADEGEILNLGVAPARRRGGLGRALVVHMLEALAARGVRAVFLEVRESNDGARRLYHGLGFAPVGVRPGYYRRPVESAVILRTAIPAVGPDA